MTLKEFLQQSHIDSNLALLLGEAIPNAVRAIKDAIGRQKGELAGSSNVYGESQLALDVRANAIVVEALKNSLLVDAIASEEMEEIVEYGGADASLYTVVFDPLDGSSLVDVNFAVGSIFGIYRGGSLKKIGSITGESQVAACYAVYGPHTTFVLTVKKGTHEFMLGNDGNFYLSRENLKIAPRAKCFAPGNLRAASQREDYLELTNRWIKEKLTLRYSGGMVPDINHMLIKGNGIFTYPGYSEARNGKLRLLFECNPMALLVEQAGGIARDDTGPLLKKTITELHRRTPIYIGSKETVEEAVKALETNF